MLMLIQLGLLCPSSEIYGAAGKGNSEAERQDVSTRWARAGRCVVMLN